MQNPNQNIAQNLYEVEQIVKFKIVDDKRYFRVKWVNYPSWQNTWEPEEHLTPATIAAFFQHLKEKEQRKNKKLQIKQQKGAENHKSLVQTQRSRQKRKGLLKIIHLQKAGQRASNFKFQISCNSVIETVTRDYLFKKDPQKLARFYLSLYLKNKENA